MNGTDDNTPDRPADQWSGSRTRVVDGLRDLSQFMELRVELPVPGTVDVIYSVIAETDEQERAEVDRIAGILGVTAVFDFDGRHYIARRAFGPVQYRAIAISDGDREWERAEAETGPIDVVTSEEWPI